MGKWLVVGTPWVGTVLGWSLVVAFAGSDSVPDHLPAYAFFGWVALFLGVAVFVVVDAVRMARRRDLAALRRSALVVKFGNVPFFVGNFVLLYLVFSLLNVIHGAGVIAAPFFVLWTYLIMLPTSAYGLALVSVLRTEGRLTAGYGVLHRLLHLTFVVDVVSSLVLAVDAKLVLDSRRRGEPWALATAALPPLPSAPRP